jgi:hypothetical protein
MLAPLLQQPGLHTVSDEICRPAHVLHQQYQCACMHNVVSRMLLAVLTENHENENETNHINQKLTQHLSSVLCIFPACSVFLKLMHQKTIIHHDQMPKHFIE